MVPCILAHRAARRALVAAVVALSGPSPAHAQRAEAKFAWQGREVRVECGVVRVGNYTVDSLEVGRTWRIGSGPASVLSTQAPLIAGDAVVAPGAYRIQLSRPQSQRFELVVEGAGRRVGASEDVALEGKLREQARPGSKLELALEPAGEASDAELKALELSILFGVPRVDVPFTVVGSTKSKASGVAIDGFDLPAAWLDERLKRTQRAPIATLTFSSSQRDVPKVFNLLLAENEAELVAHDEPPSDAFSQLRAHDPAWDKRGTVTWSEAQEEAAWFTIDEAKHDKGKELRVVARCGKRRAEIVVPLGKPAKGGGS